MVELQPSKLAMGVRFPSPALRARSPGDRAADFSPTSSRGWTVGWPTPWMRRCTRVVRDRWQVREYRHGFTICLPFAPGWGRNHSETCVGCIVPLTTVTRSSLRASRSVSWLSVAEKASRVFLASYFLR
jgi:hypothetical protein